MTTATTRQAESTASPRLMMAFELAEAHWMLGFTTGSAQRARRRQIPARDIERLEREIAAAKRRFGRGPQSGRGLVEHRSQATRAADEDRPRRPGRSAPLAGA